MRRLNFSSFARILVVLLATSALSEPQSAPLKQGETLPALVGQTLTGKALDLPTDAAGKAAVILFSFSRAGGRDAQNWSQRLAKDKPQLPSYTIIFIESVPRLFRSVAISGIRSGMPPALLDRTLIFEQQQNVWERRLQVTDENSAYVIVLDPAGKLLRTLSGPFADRAYAGLFQELRP